MVRKTTTGDPSTITLPIGARIIVSEVLERKPNGDPKLIRIVTDE